MRYLTLIVTNIGGQQNLQNHIVRVDNAKHHILVVPTVCHSFAYKRWSDPIIFIIIYTHIFINTLFRYTALIADSYTELL